MPRPLNPACLLSPSDLHMKEEIMHMLIQYLQDEGYRPPSLLLPLRCMGR